MSEQEPVDPATLTAPDEPAPATLEDVRELVHQLAATVAGLAAEVRATRADASQDAIELRARTRWLDGRIEALEAALSEQAAPAPGSTDPAGGRDVAAPAARRPRKGGAGTGEKPRKAARIKATLSTEEIERIRAEKRARPQ